jgi:hypothetical protein
MLHGPVSDELVHVARRVSSTLVIVSEGPWPGILDCQRELHRVLAGDVQKDMGQSDRQRLQCGNRRGESFSRLRHRCVASARHAGQRTM